MHARAQAVSVYVYYSRVHPTMLVMEVVHVFRWVLWRAACQGWRGGQLPGARDTVGALRTYGLAVKSRLAGTFSLPLHPTSEPWEIGAEEDFP